MSYAGSLGSYVKEHRFKKGHSGNPRSRPKGAKSRVYFKKTEFRHRTGSRQCRAAVEPDATRHGRATIALELVQGPQPCPEVGVRRGVEGLGHRDKTVGPSCKHRR